MYPHVCAIPIASPPNLLINPLISPVESPLSSNGLELFANELRTLPPEKIRTFAETEQMIFRDIFGEGGVKFTLPNKIDVSKVDGIIKYLISKFYNGHLSKIDWNSLIYIEQLKSKLYKSGSPQNVDSILEILSNDIAENVARRNAFIERKTNNGETANTRAFDLRNQQMNEIYTGLRQNVDVSLFTNERFSDEQMKPMPAVVTIHITKTTPMVKKI